MTEIQRYRVQMMDEISRCIADGHRGNGTAERDMCCQVCQEIQCDPDCAVEVSRVKVEQARADERSLVAVERTTLEELNRTYEQGQRDALAALKKDGACSCPCGGAMHAIKEDSA